MANNYLSFAEEYQISTAEALWVQNELEKGKSLEDMTEEGQATFRAEHFTDEYEFSYWPNFTIIVTKFPENAVRPTDAYTHSLYVGSTDGNIDDALMFMQRLLDKFRMGEQVVWTIEWCYTCDKARPGQFGGAAASLRPGQEMRYMSTSEWCETEWTQH